jgi:GNAT superfamily N-acetyltransferase
VDISILLACEPQSAALNAIKTAVWPDEASAPERIRRILAHPAHSVQIAVTAEGQAVGFVDGFLTQAANGQPRWEVDLLAVHPAFQGRKIGQTLIAASVAAGQARGAQSARALVQVTNPASAGAFRRCAFACDGRVYQLMIAGPADQPTPADSTAALIAVETLNYSGLWLEEPHTAATLAAGRWWCAHQRGELVGAVIAAENPAALTAAALGYAPVARFHWWTRAL